MMIHLDRGVAGRCAGGFGEASAEDAQPRGARGAGARREGRRIVGREEVSKIGDPTGSHLVVVFSYHKWFSFGLPFEII